MAGSQDNSRGVWEKLVMWWTKWRNRRYVLPVNLVLAFLLGFFAAILPLAEQAFKDTAANEAAQITTPTTPNQASPPEGEATPAITLADPNEAGVPQRQAEPTTRGGALSQFSSPSRVYLVGFTIFLLMVLILRYATKVKFRESRWGIFSSFLLGYGAGALCYIYGWWFQWAWLNLSRFDDPLRVGMVLLGVILGFFVVRNWNKSQDEFVTSLAAALGGAGVSALLGTLVGEPTAPAPTGEAAEAGAAAATGVPTAARAYFTYYFIGFTVSGTINLLLSSLLIAYYTNRRSLASRSVLGFLYGNDKAKVVDQSFQENFKENADSAKGLLMHALSQYRVTVLKEFAERMEAKRQRMEARRKESQQRNETKVTWLEELRTARLSQITTRLAETDLSDSLRQGLDKEQETLQNAQANSLPTYAELAYIRDYLAKSIKDLKGRIASKRAAYQAQLTPKEQELKQNSQDLEVARERLKAATEEERDERQTKVDTLSGKGQRLNEEIAALREQYRQQAAGPEAELARQEAELLQIDDILKEIKNTYVYQLVAILREETDAPPANAEKEQYKIVFKEVTGIEASMFRMGITIKWQDELEYVITPGEYRRSFPYRESVAGLALLTRNTIVMDRDKKKRFRAASLTKDKAPYEVEQRRDLNEIDYLSYVCVPVVGNFRTSAEEELGIVNIDTRLFAASEPLHEKAAVEPGGSNWFMLCDREQLAEYGANLYEQSEEAVRYLEEMRSVIVPVLALYLICRQGAS